MITFASDFGSPYPAAVKGVLCSKVDEDARIVDVAHDLPRQSVRAGAFWLRETLPYFPPAVHLVVIDPGVGTDRSAVALRVGDHALVGPDNGVLRPVARRLAEQTGADMAAFEITYENPASATFHGRDVFGPTAGEIHAVGVDAMATLADLEPMAVDDLVAFELPSASVADDGTEGDAEAGGRAEGEVLVVDDFGNAITNVPGSVLAGVESVLVNGERVPAVESFAGVAQGERLVTVGSHGYVECDVNHGRGDEAFGLDPGARVVLEW
ncbi:SAM hydrolase/SAM-dependent halogenase family protein [Salinirubrum litoreum]|uniref:S-adenosyl-l-methionine hydroxide adenosyltransferase family protein n=1 Tax=Salinirubrum litoreum TaxID=1126234 RepID=A0ABD5RDL7_9EURY|nr:SAM-dependent chlorinase/fluorinase [Salinirubrum litoreum]